MISTIIIENDSEASNYLSTLLNQSSSGIDVRGFSKTVSEGIKLINLHNPELVFLDIHLDDGLGFEVLDAISNKSFEVVFITAYDTYYEKAIEHFAFNYLLKPINDVILERVLERYRSVKTRYFKQSKYQHFKEFIKESNSKILLQTGQNFRSVFLNDIISCHADSNYTSFILKGDKTILANNILKYYDNLLSQRGFFRVNRSCLVNTLHIDTILKKETIVLSNGINIPISVRNRRQLNNLIETLN